MSSRGIFISYRSVDAAPYARLLKSQLSDRFPDVRVFMDMDSIEPGLDFANVIRESLDSCAVLVALIGRQWSTVTDDLGRRRLDDPDDFVRLEVQAALDRGVRVIPVLVDGARPVRQQELPAELSKLSRLSALELSYGRYEYDAARLFDLIQRVLAAASGTAIAPESSSTVDVEVLAVAHEVRPDGHVVRQEDPEVDPETRAHTIRLLADAKHAAESITNEYSKAFALAAVARALAATDPDRAAQVTADAERTAQSITDGNAKARALGVVAGTLAATDPRRAERIALSMTDGNSKSEGARRRRQGAGSQ